MSKISKFLKVSSEGFVSGLLIFTQIVIILFIFLLILFSFDSDKYKIDECSEEAEAMNLESDFVNDRCVYILPDGTRVLSDKYFVVNIPYIVDME